MVFNKLNDNALTSKIQYNTCTYYVVTTVTTSILSFTWKPRIEVANNNPKLHAQPSQSELSRKYIAVQSVIPLRKFTNMDECIAFKKVFSPRFPAISSDKGCAVKLKTFTKPFLQFTIACNTKLIHLL